MESNTWSNGKTSQNSWTKEDYFNAIEPIKEFDASIKQVEQLAKKK